MIASKGGRMRLVDSAPGTFCPLAGSGDMLIFKVIHGVRIGSLNSEKIVTKGLENSNKSIGDIDCSPFYVPNFATHL